MLPNNEIRRLLKYLKTQLGDGDLFAEIAAELSGDDGADIIREPEFLQYFPQTVIEIEINQTIWRLNIISYTALRMTQRGVKPKQIIALFTRFIEFCSTNGEIINVGAYTVFDGVLTLRVDIDDISDQGGKAHTATVFLGKGNTERTIVINFEI